jgi:hypothetical protein
MAEWLGSAPGTQAHAIDAMIAGERFFTIDEIYDRLVRSFPTTTRGRVSQHVRALRQAGAPLEERRDDRAIKVRLRYLTRR